MAITKIHPIRADVQKAVDYICNTEKTNGELLVDSFACSPKTAGVEFDMALNYGSRRGSNKAFHLIQSFAPGEVDAETAHKIGVELADKLLKGNHSYVVTTHVDTTSVHNHIMFCSADNFTHKKFVCNKKIYKHIRTLSDRLCREQGLSVIENPGRKTGLYYEDWIAEGHDAPLREKIRRDIRECIRLAYSYEDFIRLMRKRDYEVKGEMLTNGGRKAAKYIRFRASGYDQFIRGCYRSLGKGFTKEEIAAAIELQNKIRKGTTVIQVKSAEDVVKRSAPNVTLIDTSAPKFRGAPGLTKWAETQNLKTAAHAFAVGGSVPELQAKMDALKKEMDDIRDKVLLNDKRLKNNKTLAVYVRNYEENRKYGLGYRKAMDQDRYYRINESRIMLFDAAKKSIREMGIDPDSVTYSMVTDRIEELEGEKTGLDKEYGQKLKEYKEMEKQMSVMKQYIEKQGILTKEAVRSGRKKDSQER